jgi:hypothetical protein
MKLQNLIQIAIGIVCIGLLPAAQAVVPPPDRANTAEGQSGVPSASPFAVGTATHETRGDSQGSLQFPNTSKVLETETLSSAPSTQSSFMASWDNLGGATGYLLDVSTSDSFSDYVDGYHDLDVGNVTGQVVTDLLPGTTYYYRIRVYTAIGLGNYTEAMTATTVPATELTSDVTATSPEGINPDVIGYDLVTAVVTTNAATVITSSSATLNGTVDPNGLTTSVLFEYGITTNYQHTTANRNYSGSTTQNVNANISGLTPNTTYHFRIVGFNSRGFHFGSERTFRTFSPTGPPVVATGAATNVASFSASLNGSVYPHGLSTTVYFQYGTNTSYAFATAPQTKTGNTYQSVSANISGLSASTTYHFRIVTSNSAGIRYGSDKTFTTLSPTGPPVVTTNPATFVAGFSATLNGSVDSHALTTSVHFQYGTTTSYGLTTAPQSRSGNAYLNISANISSLSANTVYHLRIVATNSAGTTYGSDRTFHTLTATGPPVVTTNPATNVTSSSAKLNGSLDPHGLTTSASFQYGTTTSYGHTTAMQTQTGNTFQNIAANISGLSTHTTYHFRIVASNSGGTRFGGDSTFTTQ